jgi:hypothetical protein
MNANELADWCDEASQEYGNKPLVQAATMLRQQQAEIEALKAKTLTDEEILEEAQSYGMGEKFIQDAPLFHAIKFARAIEKRIRNGYK